MPLRIALACTFSSVEQATKIVAQIEEQQAELKDITLQTDQNRGEEAPRSRSAGHYNELNQLKPQPAGSGNA